MSVPVVIVGQNPNLATHAIKYLAPEYEVVAFVESPEEAASAIPAFLAGAPAPVSSPLGSQDFSKGIKAVIVGGTYDDAKFQAAKAAVPQSSVPWLQYDASKPEPTHDAAGGAELIARIKAALAGVDFDSDSVTLY
ncbi:hypothetical protein N7478_009774 [Penicillium angulare]|uniref:uncharacterized protein n=1 Tax=Penicillium angulare TaxID=116970 RepID=UPI0025411A5B|nr:uncharacterized protein N7478_009774 [Penicillium angulare]KAJ5266966.1 hypothetical protein N7478_009774 [Penicillium angulare]